jgi:hypothetical protein
MTLILLTSGESQVQRERKSSKQESAELRIEQSLEPVGWCSHWRLSCNQCSCLGKILRPTELRSCKRWDSCMACEVSDGRLQLVLRSLLTQFRFQYNNWRPVTAIQRTDIWLSTGLNVSDPSWTPLLIPTPSHPDYPSTHATFGGTASAVIRAYNKGSDTIDATISSNVTLNNRGVITRTYTNLTAAAIENGESRVFGGVSYFFCPENDD